MKKQYVYLTLDKQKEKLIQIAHKNPNLAQILKRLEFPNGFPWFIGAGCLNQTVWNHLTDRHITYGIGDYDVVYWDDDISRESEVKVQQEVLAQFKDLDIELEVINQARVHVWFEEDFGEKIDPFESVEHAISTWPTTATCIALTKIGNELEVIAPYGLNDLFNMVLRPNVPSVLDDVFKAKVKKWTSKWPELTVIEPKLFV